MRGSGRAPEADPFSIVFDSVGVGYEAESKAVRKYRVNDMQTVKRALDDNVEEYLENELGYVRVQGHENFKLGLSIFVVLITCVTHYFPLPYPQIRPIMYIGVVTYYATILLLWYVSSDSEGQAIFVTREKSTVPIPRGAKNKASAKSAKKMPLKHVLHVRSGAENFTPTYTLEVILVPTSKSIWRSVDATAENRLEKKFNIGEFFDKDGWIYPPAVKRAVNSLVAEAKM